MFLPFRRRARPRIIPALCLCTSLIFLSVPTTAIWPFPPKRFTGNALLGAGSLGLEGDGRVVAFGDFNGDQL